MSITRANNTIEKPLDSNGYNTVKFRDAIGQVMERQALDGYFAKYCLGITFGANLTKWRETLKSVFNYEKDETYRYNDVKSFEHALIISDPVFVEDNDEVSKSLVNNLRLKLYGESGGYLHTKLILIYLKNNEGKYRYVLFTGSKNITNSNNFDILISLVSKEASDDEGTKAGGKIRDYLNYLLSDDKSELDKEYVRNLGEVDFDVDNEEGEHEAHVFDFELAYGDKRFRDKTWKRMSDSPIIISPYISENQYRILDATKVKKVLSYQQTYNKLSEYPKEFTRFVGGTIEGRGRYKFHSKMYISTDNGNTVIYLGSANLTDEAMDNHYELIIGIRYEDKGEIFNYFNKQIVNTNNDLLEELSDSNLVELPDIEDTEEQTVAYRCYRYALYKEGNLYELRQYSSKGKVIGQRKGISPKDISNWMDMEGSDDTYQVFIWKNNYYADDSECKFYVSYKEFEEVVKQNANKYKNEYYENIFRIGNSNLAGTSGGKGSKRNNTKSKASVKYPCMFRMVQDKNCTESDVKDYLRQIYDVRMDGEDKNYIVGLMKGYIFD